MMKIAQTLDGAAETSAPTSLAPLPAMVDLEADAKFSILSIGPGIDILTAHEHDDVRNEVRRITTHLTP